jgi:hypothetical protein
MINSITERQRRTIVIDRILKTNNEDTNDLELVTDPDEIKKLTALHFQTIADGLII